MRLRLILAFISIVLVSVLGVVLLARQSTTNEVRAFMLRSGMVDADELVNQLADYYAENGAWSGVESLFPGQGHGRGMGNQGMMGQGMMSQELRLADSNLNIIVDTTTATPEGKLTSAESETAIPIRVQGETVGYLILEGGIGTGQNEGTFLLNRLNRAALIAGVIAAGLAILIALVLAYGLLRPVSQLTKAAEQLAEGDLSHRVEMNGNDEVAKLGQSFNRMANSLEKAQESRQALTADIAHELRTPLSVQRAHLEALLDGIYPLTLEHIQPILEQNLLLTRLVDDLRTLALADAGQLMLETTSTDIPELVQRVIERFIPQAHNRQISISLKPHDSLPAATCNCDPQRIEQILGNLISNALRYTQEGGTVEIHLSQENRFFQIAVLDNGPGIPPDVLPYIFDRFYRADRSRSRAEGGSGLGLAIARQLAEAHGGSLVASNASGGGAVFTLSLPVKGNLT